KGGILVTTETVVRFIIEVIAASGIVMFIGKNWIENQFARRLKVYERKQNALFNRITKIHEKEIEVLPAAWQKLLEAHGHLARLIQPSRIEREFSHEVYENIYKKTEPIKERIRDLVQKRLHYQDAD